MERIIRLLKTANDCEEAEKIFIDLAIQARRRSIELRALSHTPKNDLEKELYEALYAYEDVLTYKNKRRTRASRTLQMINRYGIVETAQRAVNRPDDAIGFQILMERGLLDKTFEYVITKYPKSFKPDTVAIAKERLSRYMKL